MTAVSLSQQAAVRDELIRLVERELCGPHSFDEVIAENPHTRYITGQLAPARAGDAEQDEDEILEGDLLAGATSPDVAQETLPPMEGSAGEADSAESEETTSITRARRDSLTSIGISFAVDADQELVYRASWGEYERDAEGRYHRLSRSSTGSILIGGSTPLKTVEHGRTAIKWVVRTLANRSIATIFLVNATKATARDGTERLYQVELELSCSSTSQGFLPREGSEASTKRVDTNDLLYRHRREYGIGLHTAVEPVIDETRRCHTLITRSLPAVETRVTEARPVAAGSKCLDMVWLSDNDDVESTCKELSILVTQYGSWLDELREALVALPSEYLGHGEAQCERIADRIARLDAGLQILRDDPNAFKAFRFANESMSRAQFRSAKENRTEEDQPFDPRGRSGIWRPFQIAFLLSSLNEIVRPSVPERRIVDVLFFPTGGGKTEAYLGLSAFTMAFRRFGGKAPNGGAGTSTLMRYTLRLLTTQQFSRAATLICAAETIRREATYDLGDMPFSIGLWVGPMTPNSFDVAVEAVKKARAEHVTCVRRCELSSKPLVFAPKPLRVRETANVLPITDCPWCFTAICIENVATDDEARRLAIVCPNSACSFSRTATGPVLNVTGLPIFVVDEDVYRMAPTIVVASRRMGT